MPYSLREDKGILHIVFSGTLTNKELVLGGDEVSRFDLAAAVVPHRISDLRTAERLEIDFHGIFALAYARRRLRFHNPFKSAIIAPDIVRFGCARMYQTLNDHPQISIAIFPDVPEATAWIAAPGQDPPPVPWHPPPEVWSQEPRSP